MATITVQVPDDRYQKLVELAQSLGITPEQLVQASVEDMLVQPREDFWPALSYILEKDEARYKRLAA